MTLSVELIAAVFIAYFAMLMVTAHIGDTSPAAIRLARHPLVLAVSLGVYATSWSYFGSVGLAAQSGYQFLAFYIGVTIACAASPVLWEPLARVLRERQLATLPDLFAFRYRSQALGVLATLFLLAGSLPYQALQLRGLITSVEVLGGPEAPRFVGLLTSVALALFGSLFGARNLARRERHDGLVLAIAVESVVKLVALLAVAAFAFFGPLHGVLPARPFADGDRDAAESALAFPWLGALFLAFSAAFVQPRQWHLAFTEGVGARAFRTIGWALPLYLLLLTAPVPLVLAAGQRIDPTGNPNLYVLTLARASESPAFGALVLLGGISASTAMILVTAIALASMSLTHLVLPLTGPFRGDLYRRLRWVRRALIAAIVAACYVVYLLLPPDLRLTDLGNAAFVAVAQFLPGLGGVLLWPRATARGVIAGLSAGALVWTIGLVISLLVSAGVLPLEAFSLRSALSDSWSLWRTYVTALSLGANIIILVVVSLLSSPRTEEAEAAAVCRREALPPVGLVVAGSPSEFVARLSPVLGPSVASQEVERARLDLELDPDERRPGELRRLRDQIEQNLSGLLGPVLSLAVIEEGLSLNPTVRSAVAARLLLIDERHGPPSVSALDAARRYLQRIVEDLPEGVCTVDPHGEVVLWNAALARMTSIPRDRAVGAHLLSMPAPWGPLLDTFSASPDGRKQTRFETGADTRELVLVKSAIDPAGLAGAADSGGFLLLVEDRTEQHLLQAQIAHQDRLASIGRVAAGLAHEIGNPLTGIASVAQNLREDVTVPDAVDRLDLIVEQTRRIDRIVRTLVGFAHGGSMGLFESSSGSVAALRVTDVVHEVLTLTRLGRPKRAVEFVADIPADLHILGDRQRLCQVLVNLCANACDASRDGSTVEIRARADGTNVLVAVTDRGCGMPAAVLARALEPFFTTKPVGEGTGLGLSLAYGIIGDLGGTLVLQSEVGTGTTVTVGLPGVPLAITKT